jgi:hypothetical protein
MLQRYSFNQSGYNWQRSVRAVAGCVSEIIKKWYTDINYGILLAGSINWRKDKDEEFT